MEPSPSAKLTSVGYGNPYFASFYPNCYSIFGFNDGAVTDADLADLSYDIVGWYSDAAKDPLKAYVDEQGAITDIDAKIESEFSWKSDEADQTPDGMICFARLTFSPDADITNNDQENQDTTITVGNTLAEALAARLAKTLDDKDDNRFLIEQQLLAIQDMDRLERLEADYVAQFSQILHSKGFTARDGGSLWTIVRVADSSKSLVDKSISSSINLDAELATALDNINALQVKYNQGQREIATMRRHLFADWYKYMMCVYPSDRYEDDYPDIDRVKNFIEKKDIRFLEDKIKRTGTLVVNNDATGLSVSASTDSPASSIAYRLATSITALISAIDAANSTADVQYAVKQVPAPRFWQPNNPVVLMTGDAAKATSRHGQDGVLDAYILAASGDLQKVALAVSSSLLRLPPTRPRARSLPAWQHRSMR